MKQELIQSFVVWCEETAAKLELEPTDGKTTALLSPPGARKPISA